MAWFVNEINLKKMKTDDDDDDNDYDYYYDYFNIMFYNFPPH